MVKVTRPGDEITGVDERSPTPSSLTQRLRRAAPLAVLSALTVAVTLLPPHNHHPRWIAAGTAAYALLLALEVVLPWHRLPAAWAPAPLLASFAPLGLVRHGADGAASGLTPVLIVPVVAVALHHGRRAVAAALACGAATLLVPLLLVGAPMYPLQEWRRLVLWLVASGLVGLLVHRLVSHLRLQAQHLSVLAGCSRDLAAADDAREAICAAARQIAGADGVYLLEADGDGHLRTTGASGPRVPAVVVDLDGPATMAARAFAGHDLVFAADALTHPGVRRDVLQALGAGAGSSAAWQPVRGPHGALGVLVAVWGARLGALPAHVPAMLQTLAGEAAGAVERADLLHRLSRAADRDPLTGLANRRRWDEAAADEVARAVRSGQPLTIGIVDLDHFKRYNDTRGHLAGDVLLRDFAAAAAGQLRAVDTIARWGGEEFALALPGCALEDARTVAERLLAVVPDGQSCTVGLAQWWPGTGVAETLRRADAALYAGKEGGRGVVRCDEGTGGATGGGTGEPAGSRA